MPSEFIRCPSCGKNLGVWADFYNLARLAYIKEHMEKNPELKDVDPANLTLLENSAPELRPLFRIIGLNLPCCVTRMLTGKPITDVFANNMNNGPKNMD